MDGQTIKLKLKRNPSQLGAIKLAKKQFNLKEMSKEDMVKTDYIYIEYPNGSDLIIRKGYLFDSCTSEEWVYFFYNVL